MALILLDFDQIKNFVYASPMLRAIRGSSSILAEINNFDPVQNRVQEAGGSLIYAGGGSVLARFSSPERAQEFVTREKALLKQLTCGGASFTHVIEPSDDFHTAQSALLRAKARRVQSNPPAPHGLCKPCQACASRPAIMRNALRNVLVCRTCDERIQRGSLRNSNRQHLLNVFLEQAGQSWREVEEADDLETLASVSRNYIGVIQADGNAMGERLRYLAKLGNITLFTEFSAQCRQATEEALYRALLDAYPQPPRIKGTTLLPFELVIVGGDDVALITTADRAIQVAISLCEGFTDTMSDWAKSTGHNQLSVAMSAGVVFARSNYPLVMLDEVAGQLLKSAKQRSRQWGKEALTPTLDFMAVRATTVSELKALRQKVYQQGDIWRTQRPYTTRNLQRLFGVLQWIKYPDDTIQPFPRSKLHDLYDIPFKSFDQARLEYRSFLGRLVQSEHKPQRAMLQKLAEIGGLNHGGPWRSIDPGNPGAPPDAAYDTNLLDAIELYDFVSRPVTRGTTSGQEKP